MASLVNAARSAGISSHCPISAVKRSLSLLAEPLRNHDLSLQQRRYSDYAGRGRGDRHNNFSRGGGRGRSDSGRGRGRGRGEDFGARDRREFRGRGRAIACTPVFHACFNR
eukprot:13735-Heterococcus_DN1.PRE.1